MDNASKSWGGLLAAWRSSLPIAEITEKDFQIKIGKLKLYRCPKCDKNDVKIHYKYCPHCGIKLVFKV